MIETAGVWEPEAEHKMFQATQADDFFGPRIKTFHRNMLLAVNEFGSDMILERVGAALDLGNIDLFIDSGIFWLTNQHMRAHNMTMDVALSIAPDDLDDFDWLWEKYLEVIERYEGKTWGYVELDQGGAANKVITRKRLQDMGLSPIPVWHPLNDGLDYGRMLFDEYDRICLGNVVQAEKPTRLRIMQAASMLKREAKTPTWVHVLGYNGDELLHAFPFESCDASSWKEGIRWGRIHERSDNATVARMPSSFIPAFAKTQGEDRIRGEGSQHRKSFEMGERSIIFQQRNKNNRDRLLQEALA